MHLNETAIQAIKEYLDAPQESRTVTRLGSIYWPSLIDSLTDLIVSSGDTASFLNSEYEFINFGMTKEFFDNFQEIRAAIDNSPSTYPHISIRFLTGWISDIMTRIYRGDKKELIEKDIKKLGLEKRRINAEIKSLQEARKESLMRELADGADKQLVAQVENLVTTDALNLQNLQTKKAIARGQFISAEERRDFANRTTRHQKEQAKNDSLVSKVKSPDGKKTLRSLAGQINELMEKSISCEEQIQTKQKDLTAIENVTEALSPLEVESRIRTELEYLRDMTKLCARRLHTEACSILKTGDRFFTLEKVHACFDLILEFDPNLLNNDRVQIFGKPGALIVPGNGNTMYDWKNNQFIIPLVPPNGDFMGSIASGIIEYRLDVDDDKKLLTSYQKLPDHKDTKSIVVLRSSLTKDYIKWMTSEYNGFKVLSKDVRAWFEHEIAPRKNEIYCPPQYQLFMLSPEEFKNLLESIEQKIAQNSGAIAKEDLWIASVLAYQQGKFNAAIEYIEQLHRLNPDHVFAYFNLGIMCMKVMKKQESIQAFQEFTKRNHRTWWTSVAAEHLRRLRLN